MRRGGGRGVGIDDAVGELAAGDLEQELGAALAGPVGDAEVGAAFEAIAGVGAQAQGFGGAPDAGGGEVGAFEQDIRVWSLISELRPPMTPARAMAFCSSAMRSMSG
jgi:hypothetical protein